MITRRRLAGLLLVVLTGSAVLGQGQTQPAGKKSDKPAKAELKEPTSRELLAWLDETIDLKRYQQQQTLQEILDKFIADFAARGKELPVLVDKTAFREEHPDAPDVTDVPVRFPDTPRRMTFGRALRYALSRVPTDNATFLVRGGTLEITTLDRAAPAQMFEALITASFDKRPLAEALEALADQTGANIVVDPRVAEKALAPVSATFRNNISLETGVRLLAEMAGLRVRVERGEVLFVSGPPQGGKEKKADLHFRSRPLKFAVEELAEWSGSNVILDPQATYEVPRQVPGTGIPAPDLRCYGDTKVAGVILAGTSPRNAALILAELAGLEVVFMEDLAVLTTAERAKEARSRMPKEPAQRTGTPK